MSFTYQQFQTSPRHQRCFPSPSFPCLLSFSVFNLLSSPPPFHHCSKALIHMPAIPDCIPVNRISVTAHTSACRFAALPAASLSTLPLSPSTPHLAQQPQRKNEKVEMSVCSFHMSGALFLVNSRWQHSPTVLSCCLYQCLTYQFGMRALKCPSWLCAVFRMCRVVSSSNNKCFHTFYVILEAGRLKNRFTQEKKGTFRHIFTHDGLK